MEKSAVGVADACVCHCRQVAASTIQEAIDSGLATSVASLQESTGAGTGCGACRCRLQRILLGLPAACGSCAFCDGCGSIQRLCRCESLVA